MTRETIKEYILQVKSQDGTEALYNRWEPDILVEVINQIYNDHEEQLKAKDEEIERMKEAMQEFVNRCEKGEVRSKYTYSKFKELLKEQQ